MLKYSTIFYRCIHCNKYLKYNTIQYITQNHCTTENLVEVGQKFTNKNETSLKLI